MNDWPPDLQARLSAWAARLEALEALDDGERNAKEVADIAAGLRRVTQAAVDRGVY